MLCSFCNGLLEFLGCLGKLAHYRCRSCGLQFGTKDYAVEYEEPCEAAEGYIQ